MTKDEAIKEITAKILLLKKVAVDEKELAFYVAKTVADILDYCRREDFPDTLVYTVVDFLNNELLSDTQGAENQNAPFPVKSIRQGDTEYTFAVKESEQNVFKEPSIENIKSKINLYRKIVSL